MSYHVGMLTPDEYAAKALAHLEAVPRAASGMKGSHVAMAHEYVKLCDIAVRVKELEAGSLSGRTPKEGDDVDPETTIAWMTAWAKRNLRFQPSVIPLDKLFKEWEIKKTEPVDEPNPEVSNPWSVVEPDPMIVVPPPTYNEADEQTKETLRSYTASQETAVTNYRTWKTPGGMWNVVVQDSETETLGHGEDEDMDEAKLKAVRNLTQKMASEGWKNR